MSEDKELEIWRRRRLLQMKRAMLAKKIEKDNKSQESKNVKKSPEIYLKKILKGRAWEVLETARHQYPKETAHVEKELIRLSSSGEIKDVLDGEQLLWLFRTLGIDVRLDTKIRVLEDGKLKTISDKIKEG